MGVDLQQSFEGRRQRRISRKNIEAGRSLEEAAVFSFEPLRLPPVDCFLSQTPFSLKQKSLIRRGPSSHIPPVVDGR
jgi:hypothetical protein